MATQCIRCALSFRDMDALAGHLRTSAAHHVCATCIIDFPCRMNLVLHYQFSPLHNYCPGCDTHFATQVERNMHIEAAHNMCLLCVGLVLPFASQQDLREHYQRYHGVCLECRAVFGTPEALHVHNRGTHWYCMECRRVFKDGMTLAKHLDTNSAHVGRTIPCPALECMSAFAYSSALIQHLESGGCRSKMDRADVNRIAVKLDADNVITNPARLLAGPGGYLPPNLVVFSWATGESRNPVSGRYECSVCLKDFKNLGRLQQHLQSPVHDVPIYRCPRAWQGCGAEFRTLSALCQHVEGGVCEAGKFNASIQKYVGSLGDGVKRLAL